MKIMCITVLAMLGLLAAVAYGDEAKAYRVDLVSARIGTVDLNAGAYKLLIHRDGNEASVRLTNVSSGNVVDVPAKVESGDQKFERTEVHSSEAGGVKQITEIRIGGTNLRVTFEPASL